LFGIVILPKKNQIFNLIYYSHIHLVIMAMVMTAAMNFVLTQYVSWPAVLLIGLGTFVTYSLDNLVDWKKDKALYPDEFILIKRYQYVSIVLVVLAIIGIGWIMLTTSAALTLTLVFFAAVVLLSTIRFAAYRRVDSVSLHSIANFFVNRVFISLVWSAVCIFVPLMYEGMPVTWQAWSSLIYLWPLVFVYAVIWKLEKSEPYLRSALNTSPLRIYLQHLCLLTTLIPITNFILGKITSRSLVNILPGLAIFILLEILHLEWKISRKQLLRISMIMGGVILVVFLIHLIFG
jgi:hypothetical protein